ncbi:MAG TPA: ferritin-like domain-containing protein [Abditibacteriaceae bacterium]
MNDNGVNTAAKHETVKHGQDIDETTGVILNRRAFFTRMSAAGLGLAAASMLGGATLTGCGGGSSGSPGLGGNPPGVLDPTNFPGITGRNINEVVLNYALALEILEADLYRQALNRATNRDLNAPLAASPSSYPSSPLPGGGVEDAADSFRYLRDFVYVEAAHRDFLRAAIRNGGGTPIAPNPGGYTFGPNGPGNDLKTILTNIRVLEETGVRAYLGAAGFITDLNLTTVAVGIYSTEARHSAIVNKELGLDPGPEKMTDDKQVTPNYPSENTFEYFLDPPTVLNAIKPFFK